MHIDVHLADLHVHIYIYVDKYIYIYIYVYSCSVVHTSAGEGGATPTAAAFRAGILFVPSGRYQRLPSVLYKYCVMCVLFRIALKVTKMFGD